MQTLTYEMYHKTNQIKVGGNKRILCSTLKNFRAPTAI